MPVRDKGQCTFCICPIPAEEGAGQGEREVVWLDEFHLSCHAPRAFGAQNSSGAKLWMTKFLGSTGDAKVTNVTFVCPLLPILCAGKRHEALRNRNIQCTSIQSCISDERPCK